MTTALVPSAAASLSTANRSHTARGTMPLRGETQAHTITPYLSHTHTLTHTLSQAHTHTATHTLSGSLKLIHTHARGGLPVGGRLGGFGRQQLQLQVGPQHRVRLSAARLAVRKHSAVHTLHAREPHTHAHTQGRGALQISTPPPAALLSPTVPWRPCGWTPCMVCTHRAAVREAGDAHGGGNSPDVLVHVRL